MNDRDSTDDARLSRRTLLCASGGALALSVVGSGRVGADEGTDVDPSLFDRRCPEATFEPSMGYCAGASTGGCADDHPVTVALQRDVRETLETEYPNAGALVDAGFKPYFDTFDGDDDGWSHWLHPEYIGDDAVLDPDRPESVLVDNDSWRSIGVMFIATRDGEPVEPPAVYDESDDADDPWGTDEADWDGADDRSMDDDWDEDRGRDDHHHGHDDDHHHGHDDDHHHGHDDDHHHGHDDDHHHGHDDDHHHGHDDDHHHGHDDDHHHERPPADDPDRCSPWHYHAGLPGRFAWWFYRAVYERDFDDADDVRLPCRTPCMMHVWTVEHPGGVYAHGGPPPEYRDQPPAEEAGFDTDAEPGSDELGWEVLPDDVAPDERPESLSVGFDLRP